MLNIIGVGVLKKVQTVGEEPRSMRESETAELTKMRRRQDAEHQRENRAEETIDVREDRLRAIRTL